MNEIVWKTKQKRAIESDSFPFEDLSLIAEQESWRKEVNRPIYHLHKWWAQRLGSVFRAILLGTFASSDRDLAQLFFEPVRIPDAMILDPFMGSGTTVGEALKLGIRAIGRDINPVAYFNAKNAFHGYSRDDVLSAFSQLREAVSGQIQHYYRAKLADGSEAQALYYFWVKQIPCPECDTPVDLFPSYIFAKHAYPRRYPSAKAVCPSCGEINTVQYNATEIKCSHCRRVSRSQGPAGRANATCPKCEHVFPIARTAKSQSRPPRHRMYAKMVLLSDGETKQYQPVTEYDLKLYRQAAEALEGRADAYPKVAIQPGYNTNQTLAYGYTQWHELFNERQLLCLDILGSEIRRIADEAIRDLFVSLFSGVLEFNNMFASFKGEGTGAVRHMFSHHILKPERMPLEANLWGTKKSSGSFSTLFKSRILRALDYADHPFEIRPYSDGGRLRSKKVFHLSSTLGLDGVALDFESFNGQRLYLSCGDSSKTDIPNGSVDAVITDPPFFDNVHYSQLADFFYVWQQHLLSDKRRPLNSLTTRSDREVQNSDVEAFSERLQAVFSESCRVLRPQGLLVFTYHHSRAEGWSAILDAVHGAGFGIVATQPIKSEMSVAQPKHQASEPIDIDVIVVCRKLEELGARRASEFSLARIKEASGKQIERFNRAGRSLSRGDVRVIFMAQLVKVLSLTHDLTKAQTALQEKSGELEEVIQELHAAQRVGAKKLEPDQGQMSFSGFAV